MKEKTNFVVYEKYLVESKIVVYVGMGSESRPNDTKRVDDELNKLTQNGYIGTKIIYKNLTEGEAKRFETLLIQK